MLITDLTHSLIESVEPVTFTMGKLFLESFKEMKKTYPNLDKKYESFIGRKTENITNKFGTHDYQFVGGLSEFRHCHLMHDAILIYRIQKRNIELLYVCKHDEIKTRNIDRLIKRLRESLTRSPF